MPKGNLMITSLDRIWLWKVRNVYSYLYHHGNFSIYLFVLYKLALVTYMAE